MKPRICVSCKEGKHMDCQVNMSTGKRDAIERVQECGCINPDCLWIRGETRVN